MWVNLQTPIPKVLEREECRLYDKLSRAIFHEIFVFLSLLAIAYTGTIKLKQSWLDQFENGNTAESKILTGNIEQAVRLTVPLFHNDKKNKK